MFLGRSGGLVDEGELDVNIWAVAEAEAESVPLIDTTSVVALVGSLAKGM